MASWALPRKGMLRGVWTGAEAQTAKTTINMVNRGATMASWVLFLAGGLRALFPVRGRQHANSQTTINMVSREATMVSWALPLAGNCVESELGLSLIHI